MGLQCIDDLISHTVSCSYLLASQLKVGQGMKSAIYVTSRHCNTMDGTSVPRLRNKLSVSVTIKDWPKWSLSSMWLVSVVSYMWLVGIVTLWMEPQCQDSGTSYLLASQSWITKVMSAINVTCRCYNTRDGRTSVPRFWKKLSVSVKTKDWPKWSLLYMWLVDVDYTMDGGLGA